MTSNISNYVLAGLLAVIAGLGAATVKVTGLQWSWQLVGGVIGLGACALVLLTLGLANSFGSERLKVWLEGPVFTEAEQRQLRRLRREAAIMQGHADATMLKAGAVLFFGLLAYVALR